MSDLKGLRKFNVRQAGLGMAQANLLQSVLESDYHQQHTEQTETSWKELELIRNSHVQVIFLPCRIHYSSTHALQNQLSEHVNTQKFIIFFQFLSKLDMHVPFSGRTAFVLTCFGVHFLHLSPKHTDFSFFEGGVGYLSKERRFSVKSSLQRISSIFFVVETKRFVNSHGFVNVILTRQTCGQRSSRAAESKRRALENCFSEQICYMFLMSKCRGD